MKSTLGNSEGDDVILAQIASRAISDSYSILINGPDFASGKLNQPSNIRPNRILTADSAIILYKVGALSMGKIKDTIEKLIEILKSQ